MIRSLENLHEFIVPTKRPEFVVSVSGGKDSAAASLHLTELGIPHRRVFANTGWEHEKTYEYLRGPLTAALGPIDEVQGEFTLPDLVRNKGMFPSRTRRFCTVELKVEPLKAYIADVAKETGRPVVNVIGIRRAESVGRRDAAELEIDAYKCGAMVLIWRTLVDWTADDVAEIHQRHGLAMNPLYGMGAKRVGCWPCINASKGELRLLGKIDPRRVSEIAALELEAQATAAARYARRGETFESLGYMRPSFFMQVGPKSEREAGQSWPIHKVMQWARTSRGGKQYDMDFEDDDGCIRYGLCDSAPVAP